MRSNTDTPPVSLHGSCIANSALILLALALAGCAATPANHYDPLESVNRPIYGFNSALDHALIKPVAEGYNNVVPGPIRQGVNNFFGNLDDLYIGVSDLLEGRPAHAGSDVGRIAVNSTFGLLGIFDVATPIGLKKNTADFGTVLGHWGVGSGPYIVAPLLGPKTVRDSADWIGTYYLSPIRAVHPGSAQFEISLFRDFTLRARLLSNGAILDAGSFGDEYSFVRDGYLQHRYSMNYDGNPPKPLQLGSDDIGLDDPGDSQPADAKLAAGKPKQADTAKPVEVAPLPSSNSDAAPAKAN